MSDGREAIRLLVVGASLPRGSLNNRLAELAASLVEANGGEVDLASMHEFDAPSYNGDVCRRLLRRSRGAAPAPLFTKRSVGRPR